jgi:hypothetical protein
MAVLLKITHLSMVILAAIHHASMRFYSVFLIRVCILFTIFSFFFFLFLVVCIIVHDHASRCYYDLILMDTSTYNMFVCFVALPSVFF